MFSSGRQCFSTCSTCGLLTTTFWSELIISVDRQLTLTWFSSQNSKLIRLTKCRHQDLCRDRYDWLYLTPSQCSLVHCSDNWKQIQAMGAMFWLLLFLILLNLVWWIYELQTQNNTNFTTTNEPCPPPTFVTICWPLNWSWISIRRPVSFKFNTSIKTIIE